MVARMCSGCMMYEKLGNYIWSIFSCSMGTYNNYVERTGGLVVNRISTLAHVNKKAKHCKKI